MANLFETYNVSYCLLQISKIQLTQHFVQPTGQESQLLETEKTTVPIF